MATAPTGRQAEILAFIEDHVERHGYPPTVREIGTGVGLASPSTVHRHLEKLEEGGHLKRDPSKPRAMLVGLQGGKQAASAAPAPMTLPLVGAVAAGSPILAEEHVEDHVAAPFAADYLLRVKGDSMINAGILDGDLLIARVQATADPGTIVVALIDGEATVKRYFPEPDGVRLQPENPAMAPIRIRESDARDTLIQGVVVAVFRRLNPTFHG